MSVRTFLILLGIIDVLSFVAAALVEVFLP